MQLRLERKSSSKEVLLALFVKPGELRRAQRRAKQFKQRGAPVYRHGDACDCGLDLVRG